ncbi:MAG: PadR family transcriptional regulator [Spirochaetes bacterium]|nr:PadR family transcriptional regulator [Spirochaetota bacterium]
MELKLIILGFLKRTGPLHGYELKDKIAKEVSDFVNVKLSNVYYHLDKLHDDGFLNSETDSQTGRLEKTVYSINEKGIQLFRDLLEKLLLFNEESFFKDDVILYFADEFADVKIIDYFQDKLRVDENRLYYCKNHMKDTLKYVPEDHRKTAEAVFLHSILHLKAEIKWTQQIIQLYGEKNNE